jgi:hypothetical protein
MLKKNEPFKLLTIYNKIMVTEVPRLLPTSDTDKNRHITR